MSEDFTLYRGEGGTPRLVGARCAHRGTQLSTGWVEGDSVRCRYHGWRYDGSGQCVEQPGEEAGFAPKVKIPSYPVKEYLGLLFAYLGEGEAPPIQRFPQFEQPGLLFALPPEIWPCNYYNRLDNDADGYHVVYTHAESIRRVGRSRQYSKRTITSQVTPYGVRTTNHHEPIKPDDDLHSFMPNANQIRVATGVASAKGVMESQVWEDRITWAVPVDDATSLRFEVNLVHMSGPAAENFEKSRREELERVKGTANRWGEKILKGELSVEELDPSLSTYELFRIEDYICQVGQGRIWDRSQERLGHEDTGVVLRRKLWERELMALAEGKPLTEWIIPESLNGHRG
jgi:5,5'-dehydrodivanillate O-demethylase